MITESKQKHIDKELESKKFYRNEDGIIISEEYPKNEQTSKEENYFYKSGGSKDVFRKHYLATQKICGKYYPSSKNVLEVGAGWGYFSKMFVKEFKPKSYTVYEFSKVAAKKIKKRLRGFPTKITVRKESFRNVSDIERYDCVIALEVLEHVNWDREFLSTIKSKTWVFISVPSIHAYSHVRAYLTPDSIFYRYKDILDIKEIREVEKIGKYPYIFVIASQRR